MSAQLPPVDRDQLVATRRGRAGSAPSGGGSPHHSPTFDIDEASLVIGAELVSRTVVRYRDPGLILPFASLFATP